MLLERSEWTHRGPRLQTTRSPKIGEIVLIEENFTPRNLWQYGKIVEILGDNQNIRNVKLLTSNGRILSRPITRLYLLELNPQSSNTDHGSEITPEKDPKSQKVNKSPNLNQNLIGLHFLQL